MLTATALPEVPIESSLLIHTIRTISNLPAPMGASKLWYTNYQTVPWEHSDEVGDRGG